MTKRGYAGCLAALAAVAACGGGQETSGSEEAGTITLYTCVSDTTIAPVIEEFESANPGTSVDLYRAATGDLNARIAGDVRSGGLGADVIWGCDPLTMQDYVDQGLVGGWTPQTDVPANLRTDDYVGAAVLYMVAVSHAGVEVPRSWSALTGEEYADGVAVPDPAFAASALGALGYFAQDPDYGTEFYQGLKDNGAVQVSTPDDVVTGVAENVYEAGITIANSAYVAQESGSPIETVWPKPGAIAIYGPVALAADAAEATTAKDFISYVTSEDGQRLIADNGSYPALEDIPGPTMPVDAPVVFPDWPALAAEKDSLLTDYQQIFGG
jgi:iron(III) transport system substrate-binding protein